MIKVVRLVYPDCRGCLGASFGDCDECTVTVQEIPTCKECSFRDKEITYREKLLCHKIHMWVDPDHCCGWGKRREKDEDKNK